MDVAGDFEAACDREEYSGTRTRQRVERQMDRHREERGGRGRFSPVDAAFSRTDERMNQSPRDRESNTRSINPPERRVQNSRGRRSRETPASRRSASTDRTANTVVEERKPAMSNCRKNENLQKKIAIVALQTHFKQLIQALGV